MQSFEDIINSRERIINLQKPKSYGEPVTFPEDIVGLTDDALGKLMMRLTAFRGYALYQLAVTDVQHAGAKALYDDQYRKVVSVIDTEKKSQTLILQEALEADDTLQEAKELLDRLGAEVNMLERLQKIYEIQVNALSRELSRRYMITEQSKISPGM